MSEAITRETLDELRTPEFRRYAERYLCIEEGFRAHIEKLGMRFAEDNTAELSAMKQDLVSGGVVSRNNASSYVTKSLSPACSECTTCEKSATYYISLKCHRQCFFCFNPNQMDYERHAREKRDLARELRAAKLNGRELACVALTGGEPLLFPEETKGFFEEAKRLFPEAHTRLYTSGDLLTHRMIDELAEIGLDEIRFSVKLDDPATLLEKVTNAVRRCMGVIPSVMVEMPVIPGTLQRMERLLDELDCMGVSSINLLEFCFPFHNVDEFVRRGYEIKNPPYRVLYSYGYAGGLPVAGSEEEALRLMRRALDLGYSMGVHYCSLENKFSAQIWDQNKGFNDEGTVFVRSPRDFFIKTAKVFGGDVGVIREALLESGVTEMELNDDLGFLQFNPKSIGLLRHLDADVAISYQVEESRDGEKVLLELKVERTTTRAFGLDEI